MLVTTVSANRTISLPSSPRTSGPLSQMEATAIAGMVRPMLASADPSARFTLVWRRFRSAARTAATVSGSSTSSAITTPTTASGAPADSTADSRFGETGLGQADHRDQADEQQSEADQCDPPSRRGGMMVLVLVDLTVRADRQEVVAVPDGLDEDEHAVQHQRRHARERELSRAEPWARCAGRERRQHQTQRDQRSHHRERGVRRLHTELLHTMPQRADNQ